MTTDNTHDEEPQAWCPGCGDRIPTEVIRKRGVCSNCYGTTDDPWATDQALAEAWAEGHRTGWEHCQDGNYGNDYWDDPTPNPYAAARAVTTAEQPCRHCGSCDGPPSCPDCDHADRRTETTTDHPCGDYPAPCNCDDPDTHDGATTETTTATIEDAARVMRDEWMQHGPEVTWLHMARALDARGLLATARAKTTTEDVRAEVKRLLLRHGHAEWTEHDARIVTEVLDSAGLLAKPMSDRRPFKHGVTVTLPTDPTDREAILSLWREQGIHVSGEQEGDDIANTDPEAGR